MIDTIVIRIHNIDKKERLIARLLSVNSGFTRESLDIKEHDAMRYTMLKNAALVGNGQNFTSHRNKLFIRSSSYEVNYIIDASNNYVEFNFSIPKYKFGTNVVQFIQHFTHKDFMLGRNSSFEFNLRGTRRRLLSFLKNFFERELYQNIEDWERDIEINRFDICFNQIFETKDEAQKYLAHQKGIKQHYERIVSKKMEFESTIYLPGKNFTCKIYHKGLEFWSADGDAAQLRRVNRKLKVKKFDIDKIGAFADRILRYEIEFKATGLNYLYKQNIFRKADPVFKILKKSHKYVENVWKKMDSLDSYQRKFSVRARSLPSWKKKENEAKLYTQMISQSTKFMLAVGDLSTISSRQDRECEYNDRHTKVRVNKFALFSEELMDLAFETFRKFFNKNQLTEKVSVDNLQVSVNNYNERVAALKRFGEKNVQEKKLSAVKKYLQLRGLYSEKVLITNCMYSSRQIYRYKKILKELGYKSLPITNFTFKKDNTFETYHQIMIQSNLCRK